MRDSLAANITFLGIFCDFILVCMWQNPDNFDHFTEVSVMVWTISEGGKIFVSEQFSFGQTQTFWWTFRGPAIKQEF
jgi:hypothetical protein